MDKWNNYWSFSGERALKTCAQVAIATIGVGAVGILDVDWVNVASVSVDPMDLLQCDSCQ